MVSARTIYINYFGSVGEQASGFLYPSVYGIQRLAGFKEVLFTDKYYKRFGQLVKLLTDESSNSIIHIFNRRHAKRELCFSIEITY